MHEAGKKLESRQSEKGIDKGGAKQRGYQKHTKPQQGTET